MATIKSYTDIEQSKKLVEILPIESADMFYNEEPEDETYPKDIVDTEYPMILREVHKHLLEEYGIPCWSLAALLNMMPKDEGIECSIFFGYYNGKGEYIEKWLCSFEKEGETTDDFIFETIDADNPVDACYELILKLYELKML